MTWFGTESLIFGLLDNGLNWNWIVNQAETMKKFKSIEQAKTTNQLVLVSIPLFSQSRIAHIF